MVSDGIPESDEYDVLTAGLHRRAFQGRQATQRLAWPRRPLHLSNLLRTSPRQGRLHHPHQLHPTPLRRIQEEGFRLRPHRPGEFRRLQGQRFQDLRRLQEIRRGKVQRVLQRKPKESG